MLKQVYEMKVQILNNNCEVVWSYDIAAPVDQSGDSWTNGKHQIMAGVVFSLRRALEQAEVFPSDPEWKWPFSICPNSESTFQKIGQKVALEEHQPTVF
ncbi:hypothetical protein M4M60_004128 [Escherichia coli]|nr:hypothetical protein [Escherichia coli]HEB0986793.1 hypothetical protein [Escherichia albertii]EIS3798340.1 hypothetical protein [Escherichia coli]EJE0458890.1 hypothetical protein [Escherichia coli]EJE0713657.1 hypothetical protein [Escherichia coli]